MQLRRLVFGLAIAGCSASAAMAQPVNTITTPGAGVLSKCFNFLFFRYCNTYHHIKLPSEIAVGDRVPIIFGSNQKSYDFPVLRITLEGDRCTLIGEQQGDPDYVDKLDISPCRTAPPR
jgi:hypothetical protein